MWACGTHTQVSDTSPKTSPVHDLNDLNAKNVCQVTTSSFWSPIFFFQATVAATQYERIDCNQTVPVVAGAGSKSSSKSSLISTTAKCVCHANCYQRGSAFEVPSSIKKHHVHSSSNSKSCVNFDRSFNKRLLLEAFDRSLESQTLGDRQQQEPADTQSLLGLALDLFDYCWSNRVLPDQTLSRPQAHR